MTDAVAYSGATAYSAGVAGQALASGALHATVAAQTAGWTIEGWVRYAGTTQQRAFLGWGTGGWLGVNGAGNVSGFFGSTGQPLPTGGWHHVALTGDGNVCELWVDGVWMNEVGDRTEDASLSTVFLGGWATTGQEWAGGLDEVRVSKGKRYAAYSNFTVPTAPFTVDAATVGLWHLDGTGVDSAAAGGSTGGSTGTGTGGSTGGSTGSGGTSTGGATSSSGTVTYQASTAVIANPERGWFQYTETHYYADGSGHTPLVAADLVNARTSAVTINGVSFTGRTTVFRYFYIEKYKDVDTVDADYLTKLAADLATVRQAGCKIILRFAYYNQQDSNSDAPPARVLGHIDQFAPTLNQYADVVWAVEAGFIGAWGEWYYTNNFGDQGSLSAQNLADRNAVISRLLTDLSPTVFVLLRYLGTRQAYLGSTTTADTGTAASARLGHHNDAFLADDGNWGTYNTFTSNTIAQNRSYLAAMPAVPVGGESGRYNPPMTEWANASTELAAYRYDFLNPNYYGQVIQIWGQANGDTASQRLGYRLRAVSSTVPGAVVAGASGSVQVVLTNDGWAPPTRSRPVMLALVDQAGNATTFPSTFDVRTLAPGQQATLTLPFTAPKAAGTYRTALWLPDASTVLQARPEYAVQLANTGTWQASTGRNDLLNPVVVTTAAGGGGGTGGNTPGTSGTLRNVVKVSLNGVTRAVKLSQ